MQDIFSLIAIPARSSARLASRLAQGVNHKTGSGPRDPYFDRPPPINDYTFEKLSQSEILRLVFNSTLRMWELQ